MDTDDRMLRDSDQRQSKKKRGRPPKVEEPEAPPPGIVCPRCKKADNYVHTSRPRAGQMVRYRACRQCQHRFETVENWRPPRKRAGVDETPTSE